MYVITITRRVKWAVGLLLTALLLIGGARVVSPVVHERNEAAPVTAEAGGVTRKSLRPIYSAQTDQKVVGLTFDISWGKVMGPKVLDVLKQENVKATFFLSGPWAKNHVEMVKRIQADGHQIESHGQAHVDLNTLGLEGAAKNIAQAHTILEQLTGRASTYIRPPNGAFDKVSAQAAKNLNYETVIWSVDSLDWKNPGVDVIINRSVKLIHPGAILLMHASDSCKQTDQALPTVIKQLREKGYKFALLDDLIREYGVDENGYIHSKFPQ